MSSLAASSALAIASSAASLRDVGTDESRMDAVLAALTSAMMSVMMDGGCTRAI